MANRMQIRPKSLFYLLSLIAAIPVLAACGSADNPQTTIEPLSDVARDIQGTYVFIFWLAVAVFIVVEGALVYAVIRYRRRANSEMPKQVEGNTALEITWTIIPALILVAIAIPTWITIFRTADVPDNAFIINITGHQWWWEVEYPELGLVTANEIHVPSDRTIGFNLHTEDVLHSFWVPQMFGKVDLVPGRTNTVWFTPVPEAEGGVYLGQCVEFCGLSHALMRMRLHVDSPSDFAAWHAGLTGPAPVRAAGSDAERGYDLFATKGCTLCHSVNGDYEAAGVEPAPNLTGFGARQTLAAAIMDNTPENLTEWLENPDGLKPGNIMYREAPSYTDPNLALQPDEISSLVSYLHSLQ